MTIIASEASTVTPTTQDQSQRPTADTTSTDRSVAVAPDAPCARNHWCTHTGTHTDCWGPEIGLPSDDGSNPGVLVGQLHYDSDDDATVLIYQRKADWIRVAPDELRAETARVRAHLVRLDALADQWDAVRGATAIRNAEASLTEHGATSDQVEAVAAVRRIVGDPVPYAVPTEVEEAERITLAGARGAILNAYLWRPMDEPATAARLSVYAEPNEDDDLDLAGARDLRAQLAAFLPKLDAMIGVLAEHDGNR